MTGRRATSTDGERAVSPAFSAAESRQAAGPGRAEAGRGAAAGSRPTKLRILLRDKSAAVKSARLVVAITRHLMDHAPRDDTPASNLSVARQRLLILFRRRCYLTAVAGQPGQVPTEMDAIRRA